MFILDTSSVFLLNPKNAPFLRGENRKLFHGSIWRVIFLSIFPLIIAGVMIWLLATGLNERTVREQLRQWGVETQGLITGHHSSRGRSTSYYLTFSYVVEQANESQKYTREEQVDYNAFQLQDGDAVRVLYLPQDQGNRIKNRN